MAKRFIQLSPKLRRLSITALVFAIIFYTHVETKIDHRVFTRALEISIERGSPPYSAFEDSQLIGAQTNVIKESVKYIALTTEKLNPPESRKSKHVISNLEKYRKLNGLVIALVDKKTNFDDPRKVVGEKYWGGGQESYSLQDRANELIVAALAQSEAANAKGAPARVLSTESGSQIYVSRALPQKKGGIDGQDSGAPTTQKRVTKNAPTKNAQTKAPTKTIVADIRDFGGRRDESFNTITGAIRLSRGAAILPGHDELKIFHVRDSEPKSEAAVRLRDASYTIDVDEPRGYMIAEVRNREGVLTARGEKSLTSLPRGGVRRGRLENVNLDIHPTHKNLHVQALKEGATRERPQYLNLADVEIADIERRVALNKKTNTFTDPDVVTPSNVLLKISGNNFWPTIQTAIVGEEDPLQPFWNRTIWSWLNFVFERRQADENSRKAILWGVVRKNGAPLSNAVVNLLNQSHLSTKYFAGPIIDKTKVLTGENGEFVIFGARTGGDFVVVSQFGAEYQPSLTYLKEGYLTKVEIDITAETPEIKTYSINNGEYVNAVGGFIGTESNYAIHPSRPVDNIWNLTKDASVLQLDAGPGFVLGHTSVSSLQKEVAVPIFTEDDYRKILETSGLSAELQRFSAYGIVTGDNFVISVPTVESMAKVIYFNPDLSIRSEDFGVADGGYVVVGLTPGHHSLMLLPEKSKNIIMRPIWVIDNQPHISFTNLEL